MIFSLPVKIGATTIVTASYTVVMLAIIKPNWFGRFLDVYLYTMGSTITNNQTTDETKFKCKFEGDPDFFECAVTKWSAAPKENKNQQKLNEAWKNTDDKFTNADLKNVNEVFQIKFNGAYWDEKKYKKKKILVASAKDKAKTYATLAQPVGIYEGTYLGTTVYFIGQSEKELKSIENTDQFKCSFENNLPADIECTIYEFSSDENNLKKENNFSDFEFKKPNTTTTKEIKEHKHYLIKFTDNTKKQEIDNFAKDIIYASVSTSKAVTFKNVKPAIYNGTNTHIFVL